MPDDDSKCTDCDDDKYLEDGKCLERKEFQISLIEVTNPTIFKLIFSEQWDEFLNEIESFMQIEVLEI